MHHGKACLTAPVVVVQRHMDGLRTKHAKADMQQGCEADGVEPLRMQHMIQVVHALPIRMLIPSSRLDARALLVASRVGAILCLKRRKDSTKNT